MRCFRREGAENVKKIKYRVNQLSIPANILCHALFILICITCLYPILLTIGISFSDERSLFDYGYAMIPKVISLEAYSFILNSGGGIGRAYINTIFVTVCGTVLSILLLSLYAYPLSRKEFSGKKFFTFFAFFTMLFSGGLVPWYIVCTQILHIHNTYFALILPMVFSAWNMLILRTFFSSAIPTAVIESAKIDGAGEYRSFFKIVLPLSKAGLATIGLFSTLAYWNDWYHSMMLITNDNLNSLQFYLQRIFLNIQVLKSGLLESSAAAAMDLPSEAARMAMCVLVMGPIVFVYPFFQKYFISGLTIGAVKG